MPDNPLLAIDVGNSRIKAGLFDPPYAGRLPDCLGMTAVPVDEPQPAAAIAHWIERQDKRPATCLLGGVNPPVIESICKGWKTTWLALNLIERPVPQVLVNRTNDPERVGSDRLFDAVAANRLRRPRQPAIVVDSGTATTVNAIDGDGAFLGGAIVAGFGLMASALHDRTAQLPRIEAVNLSPPPPALGRNTTEAIRSGLYWGLIGGVKELVEQLSASSLEQSNESPLLLLTGGASPLLVPHFPNARHEPHLTLQGMVLSANFGLRISD